MSDKPFSITITPTAEMVVIGDSMARVWRGITSGGAECRVLVAAVASRESAGQDEFARELQAIPSPLSQGQVLK